MLLKSTCVFCVTRFRYLKDDGARRLRVPAHLALLFTKVQTGSAFLDEDAADSGRSGAARTAHDQIDVRVAGATDGIITIFFRVQL